MASVFKKASNCSSGVLGPSQTSMMELFCENSEGLLAIKDRREISHLILSEFN